ncbi:ATP-dependent DNA ligase LigD phosphoesterase module /ATP-dependent DNA ligase LigD polymerase module [Nitrospirillum amazonense]|uniref:DNA ligase (ATP) n=1 Tax=Nitrospirillum amazonense TaxID=28077 RepID=A0A560FFC9_9PROT|nr:DNA ligase D [Nitrospirillum amazonense]TWB20312.1 ATP-dependent DNA ligase LigD phosphoesterase module /ATP-dependent DNA ligase LigD polymerase module [Nitrospirillum amazonense]
MALETYHKKRDFTATPEPRGRQGRKAGHSFVIQKHEATRLHYDFRLEMDGVLKSWAVTRGPSLVPGEKRLAVHVEDHPLDYGDFEGTIPKGEYGGGTVIVWDRGEWTPIGDAHKGYAKGHLDFELHGEKLGGHWHLVRMHKRPGEKRENWLLIKGEDEAARGEGDADILEERPESVKTGRVIAEVAGEEPGWSSKTGKIEKKARAPARETVAETAAAAGTPKLKGAKAGPLPDFVEPALATLQAKPPVGDRWVHEIKFDGYRLQARVEAGRVKLLTRGGLDWTKKFGKAVPEALVALPVGKALIDGELVVENAAGASDFSALQADLSEGRSDRFLFYAFDLLYLEARDLRGVGLEQRKAALKDLLADAGDPLRYSEHFDESGGLVLNHACRLSLEGIVSKVRDAAYRPGRGKGWIKSKCGNRQEFVVAGYVPSTTARRAIGSLVMGVYDEGKLRHVGRVGTGYTVSMAEELFRQLERMRVQESPFDDTLTAEERRLVRYVRPELVAEVDFRTWTGDGNIRHAAFRGLREDKDPKDVVREPAAKAPASTVRAAGRTEPKPLLKLSHPDRLYWPDEGVTKAGLADYYTEIWRSIAPFIVGRPLALLRCPNGIAGEKFFQKHAWKGLSKAIVQVPDPAEPAEGPLIAVNDLDGLLGLVQAAVLEIHPWGSTLKDWEQPDTITLDLDPGEGVAWQAVIDAAREVKDRLEQAGLAAFVKTTGGKGLHVVAPLTPKADWAAVKAFTKGIADAMAADSPDRFVATITKAKRTGKILVDYLRNQRGATAVAAYSTRARPGAAVSMPLAWEELSPAIGPAYFTVRTAPTRLAALSADPWADFRAAARPLQGAKRPARKRAG